MPRAEVQLSLIIPFRAKRGSLRANHLTWLRAYYRNALPDAEIIIGKSWSRIFSKTRAVNNGVARSHGRILAIVDADAYLPGEVIQSIADRLDASPAPRWFIPYRRLYRLTEGITADIVASHPKEPLRLATPPEQAHVEDTAGSLHGRRYGALMVVYPRAAFNLVGGMDPRFQGWGGEDVAMARALDTLWGKHKTTDNDILHLWHPKIGTDYRTRMWAGQTETQPNAALATRYGHATGDPNRMRSLVDEGIAHAAEHIWWRRVRPVATKRLQALRDRVAFWWANR